jgi:hypothetical protein
MVVILTQDVSGGEIKRKAGFCALMQAIFPESDAMQGIGFLAARECEWPFGMGALTLLLQGNPDRRQECAMQVG